MRGGGNPRGVSVELLVWRKEIPVVGPCITKVRTQLQRQCPSIRKVLLDWGEKTNETLLEIRGGDGQGVLLYIGEGCDEGMSPSRRGTKHTWK